jgi:RNA polymerase sigma factor (sigma-70 family)
VSGIDETTLHAIIQRWAPTLVLYSRQWCASPEDAVQESLIELVKEMHVPPNPIAWLFHVVRFRSQNQARAQRRREHHEQVAAALRTAWFESNSDPTSRFDGHELTTALVRLESLDREIVIARIWGQLSWSEVSELVDRPISTLHRRYTQALHELRKNLTIAIPQLGEAHERISNARR